MKRTTTFTGAKSDSGKVARTDPSLLGRSDATPIPVVIKYDFDAAASYRGGVAGLEATSPGKTGKKLKDNKGAANAYKAYIGGKAFSIGSAVERTVPGAVVSRPFLNAYGGAAAIVPANQVASLLNVPGVVAVQKDALRQPQDDNTSFIGATAVWPSMGGSNSAASNVTVGVIDTGVWPEHPMFSAVGEPAPTNPGIPQCEFGDGTNTADLGPAFTCNNKLIGAYAETDTYTSIHDVDSNQYCDEETFECSARDSEGHGTHTTTTAAGRCVASAVLYGVQRGPVCGLAPGAHVIMYRVCLEEGCFSSDSVASVDQAIDDGVDVLNFSISGGANPYSDPVELAFLDATDAGISVAASAGNSGPGAGTSDHGGPWTTTVGASTGPRFFTSTLHLTADGPDTFDVSGITLTNGISTAKPVVLAESIAGEDAKCQTPLTAGQATGKIVACQRGTNARVDKGYNVLQGGAAGMLLYNVGQQDVESDNHWLPAIHVDGPDTALLAYINGHTNVKAKWAQGNPTSTQADVMASFSSRGPLGDWIKPDVTAPGVQVLAGMTPGPDPTSTVNGPSGNLYQAIAGTSMSSPHAAGVSALVKAAHPTWSPAMIKSALMTSSVQDVLKEDYSTPADPFDDGAGSIRANRAVNPTLVFDVTTGDYVDAAADVLDRVDLNLPSVNAPVMSGQLTTKRTAMNVTGKAVKLNVYTTAPEGAKIIVSTSPSSKQGVLPKAVSSIKFDAKKPTSFYVTIDGSDLENGQYFGQVVFGTSPPTNNNTRTAAGPTPVVIPVAFKKGQGQVTLSNECSPDTFAAKTGSSECEAVATNLSSTPADVNLQVTPSSNALTFEPVETARPQKGVNAKKGGPITFQGTLDPSLAPEIISIDDITDEGPNGSDGFLPLSGFGGSLNADLNDETITNFDIPTVYFGGEAYDELGVTSDGYVVMGGGTSSDVDFVPQDMPDPARPNNVLAPFWSDLNLSDSDGGGDAYVNVLCGGPYCWLVVAWEGAKNYGDATTHDFEIWLAMEGGGFGSGPDSEWVTYSYGDTGGPGDESVGQNAGAENRDGSSAVQYDPTTSTGKDYEVVSGDPSPGGSVHLGYLAKASKAGNYRSTATLTSNVTKGTTTAVQWLTATNGAP